MASLEALPLFQYRCPWPITDGTAAQKFIATFDDTRAFRIRLAPPSTPR